MMIYKPLKMVGYFGCGTYKLDYFVIPKVLILFIASPTPRRKSDVLIPGKYTIPAIPLAIFLSRF